MKKQLGTVMLLVMTVFIGFGIIIPVLPVMVESEGGASFHLALMLSLYSAASFVTSPFWGGLSDRIGRRPILLTGLLGFSVSFFLFGISGGNLGLMYASRVIGGLFSGAVMACAVAYVADITTPETRTKGMGLVGMAIGLGFIIGPGIGGLLSTIAVEVPFFASAGLSLLAMLLVLLQLPESLTTEQRARRAGQTKPSRWTAFAGTLKYLYVLSFLVSFTLAALEATFQLFQMRTIHATPFDIGLVFLVSGIVGALIQGGVVRRRIKPGEEAAWMRLGLVLSSLGFFLILFSTNVVTAAIYMSVFGAGNALIRPCVTSLITQKTTVGQGVASGLSSSMDSLGRIVGPLLGMVLYGFNINWPFIAGGIICIAAISLVLRFTVLDRETSGPEPQTAPSS